MTVRRRIGRLLGLLLSLMAGTSHATERPYALRITPAGVQFAGMAGGKSYPLIQSFRYEADLKDGAVAFQTIGLRARQTVNGVTRLEYHLTGPAAAQASVKATVTPLAGAVRMHWTIRYTGPAREFDAGRSGFHFQYAQPVQEAGTVPAIRFVRPTGAKPYEVTGDTPYRDLEWQLREVSFTDGRLVIATSWYDPDWIYRRQFSRAADLKAEMPSGSPAEVTYDFSLVPLPASGPGVDADGDAAADVAASAAGRALSLTVRCPHPANLFVPGEPVRFTMRLRNVAQTPQDGSLHWKVWDYDGRVASGGVQALHLAPGKAQEMPVVIHNARRGMLFLDADLVTKDGDWLDRTTFGVLPERAPEGPKPQSHFGVTGVICDPATYPDQKTPDQVLALAHRAGVRWIRIGAALAAAGDGEADRDAQTWQAVLAKYGLLRHVQVHTSVPAPGEALGFLAKVRATIQRFRGLTSDMEFGNELNLAGVRPQDYVNELLRPVHDITRQIFPGCQIMSMGMGGVDKTWLDGFVAAGGMDLVDVLSVHPGSQPRAPEFWEGWRGWVFRPQALDALQAAQPGGKAVWFTEAYAPTPPERSQLDVRTSADYTVRTNVLALALGVRVIEWYQLQDGVWFAQRPNPADAEYNYGLVYTDLTPKPGYIAYAVMTGQLEGTQYDGRLELGADDLYGVRFRRGTSRVDVLWSYREKHETDLAWWPPAQFRDKSRRPGEPWESRWRRPVRLRLPAAGPVIVTDLMGNRRRVTPVSGIVTLALTGSPVYVAGLGTMPMRRNVW